MKALLFLVLAAATIATFCEGASAQTSADSCRTISVVGPSGSVRVPEKMTFTGVVSGGGLDRITFNWTISEGTIVTGQGTPVIQVELDHPTSAQTPVTATLQIGDPNQMPSCPTISSETGIFIDLDRPTAKLGDEFGTAGNDCEEGFARLDNFFVALSSNPAASGVIIIYTDERDPRSGLKRKRQLMSFIKQRKFDASRITLVDGPLRKNATTQFWLVPPGAADPSPEAGAMPDLHDDLKPTKPYLFGAEYADGIPGCSGVTYDVDGYARELVAAKARGRVVISEATQSRFARKRGEISVALTRNRVPAGRVTFVFKRVKSGQLAESVELWVIPG